MRIVPSAAARERVRVRAVDQQIDRRSKNYRRKCFHEVVNALLRGAALTPALSRAAREGAVYVKSIEKPQHFTDVDTHNSVYNANS
jgi:hypothetical protein